MINIELNNNGLVINGSENEPIFDWDHEIFFKVILGCQFDQRNRRYFYTEKSQLKRILKETVSYLEDHNFEFQKDERVAAILKSFHESQAQYEQSIEAGLRAKNSIKLPHLTTGLIRPLKSYQIKGLYHLLSVNHGANFSVPGSGKTTVIYAAFNILREKKVVDKVFIIGPRSCFQPWEEESLLCFGEYLKSARLTGSKVNRQRLYLQSDDYDMFLSTYQTTVNDIKDIISLSERHKLFMIIDESHNIKRLEGGTWADTILRLAPYATRRAILSGTPIPNSYSDLWTQITFLWPEEQVLGERSKYRYRSDVELDANSIRESIRPFFFRATKSELNLPPVNFNIVECEMNPYQASIYHALSVRLLSELDMQREDRIELRQWRKARIVRLIQAASNPALLTRYSEEFDIPPYGGEGLSIIQLINRYSKYEIPTKIEGVTKLVHHLVQENTKVVVWSSFIHNIRTLKKLLEGIDTFVVYGAIPRDQSEDEEFNREQQIREFKNTKGPAVLLANPAACAESISLHKKCHHAIYLDRTFNCGQYMQSLDRLHRIGLDTNEIVTYHILLAKNTIDETINRRLEEKKQNMIRLIEDELPIGSFETDDYQLTSSLEEEQKDFEETVKDIEKTSNNIFKPSI